MTIEKTPSGTYRIREMINGKRYTITLKEKPSKREAEAMIRAKAGAPKRQLAILFMIVRLITLK